MGFKILLVTTNENFAEKLFDSVSEAIITVEKIAAASPNTAIVELQKNGYDLVLIHTGYLANRERNAIMHAAPYWEDLKQEDEKDPVNFLRRVLPKNIISETVTSSASATPTASPLANGIKVTRIPVSNTDEEEPLPAMVSITVTNPDGDETLLTPRPNQEQKMEPPAALPIPHAQGQSQQSNRRSAQVAPAPTSPPAAVPPPTETLDDPNNTGCCTSLLNLICRR